MLIYGSSPHEERDFTFNCRTSGAHARASTQGRGCVSAIQQDGGAPEEAGLGVLEFKARVRHARRSAR